MINSTIFEKIGTDVKSFLSKIYHVFFLFDPNKVFVPKQIMLGLLKIY